MNEIRAQKESHTCILKDSSSKFFFSSWSSCECLLFSDCCRYELKFWKGLLSWINFPLLQPSLKSEFILLTLFEIPVHGQPRFAYPNYKRKPTQFNATTWHKTLSDLRWQILSLLFHKLENYFCQEGSISSQPLSKEHW